jgi:hypothetical protein
MLYMVIERYKNRNGAAVYARYRTSGRMMPEGLKYIDSWVEPNMDRCFQLMECDDESLFPVWIKNWGDLMDFEVIPVITSQAAREMVA